MSKPITDVLREIRGGVFVQEASEQLEAAVLRSQESGQASELTIKIKIKPSGANNRIMTVQPSVTSKLPAKPETQEASVFFADRGSLVRDDPEQKKLPFAERREAQMAKTGTDE